MRHKLRLFCNKYSGEIKIAAISLAISILATALIGVLLRTRDPRTLMIFAGLTVIVALLAALLINLKRLLLRVFDQSRLVMLEQTDDIFEKSLYRERLRHFAGEKKALAKSLVERTLPTIVERILDENQAIKRLNIVIDSGTTITPIFKHLMGLGIPIISERRVRLKIYTNNLAGIDAINRLDPRLCRLTERDFNLIGGKSLKTYRATTGESTQNFLKTIWEEQDKSGGSIVTLGVVTANWFLGGVGLERLSLCARGEGHYDFKVSVIKHSKYVIVTTPLGKILRLSSVDELNKLLPNYPSEAYRAYQFPSFDRRDNRIYLHTTFRAASSLSPFVNLSMQLETVRNQGTSENYVFCEDCETFEPSGDRWAVIVTELPRQYIRDQFATAYKDKLN